MLPKLSLLLVPLLLITGCFRPQPHALLPVSNDEQLRVLRALEAGNAARQSLSADGQITITYKTIPLRGQIIVLAQADGQMRLEISAPDGSASWILAANDRQFSLLDLSQRHHLTGGLHDRETLASIGFAGMEIETLAAVLLSRAPYLKDLKVMGSDAQSGHYVLQSSRCLEGLFTLTLAPLSSAGSSPEETPLVIQSMSLRPPNPSLPPTFSVQFKSHATSGLARRLEATFNGPSGETTFVLSLDDYDLNQPIQTNHFTLPPLF